MALLYRPIDPSRSYYGTDTRIGGLLLGCCLALIWHPRQLGGRRAPGTSPARSSIAGLAGVVVLAALCVFSTERGAFLYRGGFLLVDVASVAVIAAIAHPSARFNRRLGIPLLVYLGVRSYSIYLWHWPVFALTRPGVDIDAGPVPVFILRVAITLVLADLSFRLIEAPDPQRRHRPVDRQLAGQPGRGAVTALTAGLPGRCARRDLARPPDRGHRAGRAVGPQRHRGDPAGR